MKNYVQRGDDLTLTAPYALASGDGALVGSIFGIAAAPALTGGEVVLATRGVFTMAKVAALAVAVGDALYWDNTAKTVTKTATNNARIGAAVAAAANPSNYVDVRLNGSF